MACVDEPIRRIDRNSLTGDLVRPSSEVTQAGNRVFDVAIPGDGHGLPVIEALELSEGLNVLRQVKKTGA